jgi:hypothetical protein
MTARPIAAILLITALLVSPSLQARAGDGMRAFERGDYGAALLVWKPFAEQGSARAQYNISLLYEKGLGVDQDAAKALLWRTRAAVSGSLLAQKRLARMYDEGSGAHKDPAEAHKWYLVTAPRGDVHAQKRLAYQFVSGEGARPDMTQAYLWYSVAAHSGDKGAERDMKWLVAEMTPSQFREGKRLTEIWFENRRRLD